MPNETIVQLRDICSRHGVDELASCRVDSLAHEETRTGVREILPGAQTVLVLLKKVSDGMITHAHGPQYQEAASRTFEVLRAASEEMVICLRERDVAAVWPGSQVTPHQKYIAARAGLGSIGNCTLLISARHGVDVHLESIVVGEDIGVPLSDAVRFECTSCGSCLAACPVDAIRPGVVNRELCVEYRRTQVARHKGHTYCGLCMKACPQRACPSRH